jgi:hypothetical protein
MTNCELDLFWRDLPWLLTRKQVRAITGLSDEEIARLRREGKLHRHATGRRGRYFKQEIQTICVRS